MQRRINAFCHSASDVDEKCYILKGRNMIKTLILGIVTAALFSSCVKKTEKTELEMMLKSNDKNNVIKAIVYIDEHQDTSMVKYMLTDALDPRISHDIRYKGMSIYQKKMVAMQRMTGVKPPTKINHKPDSVIFKFYLAIATKRGWL